MTDEMLNKLHEVHLEILDEFDRVCRKLDIPYFLDSGTALGAIRHGGFIPWDDDIDAGMLREDYNRFLELAEAELKPDYVIASDKNDPEYFAMHVKIRKLYTYYPHDTYDSCRYQGIHLDIFPYDRCPDDAAAGNRRINKVRRYRKIYVLAFGPKEPRSSVNRFFRKIVRILPSKPMRRMVENLFFKHYGSSENHITSFTCPAMFDRQIYLDMKDMFPVKDIDFEGHTYKIMNNPDTYLKVMYGDYMKLPPEDQRQSHLQGDVIFDTRKEGIL